MDNKKMMNCSEMIDYIESYDIKVLDIHSLLDDIVFNITIKFGDWKEQERVECAISDAGYQQIGVPFLVANDTDESYVAYYKWMWKPNFQIVL